MPLSQTVSELVLQADVPLWMTRGNSECDRYCVPGGLPQNLAEEVEAQIGERGFGFC